MTKCLIEKKARKPCLLKVSKLCSYTHYLLLATGTSDRHVRAMAEHLVESLGTHKLKPLGVEGVEAGHWILVDAGDVVVHLFQEETRQHYDLDGLWRDAPRVPVDEDA